MLDIELKQCWDTLDEAIDYFLDLTLDLKALQRLPKPPTDLFLEVKTGDQKLDEKVTEADANIILTSLS